MASGESRLDYVGPSMAPSEDAMNEIQTYVEAAKVSFKVITRLQDEGKFHPDAFKHLL